MNSMEFAKMKASEIREKVLDEVQLIPEDKLDEVYDLVHYFREALPASKGKANDIMRFAGRWKDMPEETFGAFVGEISQRRKGAFSRRRNS